MTQDTFLNQLLELLSANKGYPKYQHERRIDIFVNFFLPQILEAEYRSSIDLVVPEFPLKNADTRQSTNVDYLAYSSIKNLVYLCEFKTTAESFEEQQLERYFQAQKDKWPKLRDDIETVSTATDPKSREKYAKLMDAVQTIPNEADIEVVYIAPEATKTRLEAYISREGFSFLSLETLASLQIDTAFSDEWNLVRANLQ